MSHKIPNSKIKRRGDGHSQVTAELLYVPAEIIVRVHRVTSPPGELPIRTTYDETVFVPKGDDAK